MTVSSTARQALYTEVLTALHNEAIFLPLTGKRQTAVTNKRVSGFKFGFMEYDLPLANMYPTPAKEDKLDDAALVAIIIGAAVAVILLAVVMMMYKAEKGGKPIFTPTDKGAGSAQA